MIETRCTADDGQMVALHDVGGDKGALLLAHGAGFPGMVLGPLARRLARWHTWIVDLRGHGDSTIPKKGAITWEDYGSDVLAARRCLNGAPIGIGHSLGASALLLAESRRPGSFSALYCYEPIVDVPGIGLEKLAASLADVTRRRTATFASREEAKERWRGGLFGSLPREVLDAFAEAGLVERPDGSVTLACSPEHEAQTYEAAASSGLFRQLKSIRCPVVIAGGERSSGPVVDGIPPVVAALGHATSVTLAGLGHLGPLEDPDAVSASIIRAIETPST